MTGRCERQWWRRRGLKSGRSQRASSGDDANAEVFFELFEEDEGEHCVRNQADPCWDETLQQNGVADYNL